MLGAHDERELVTRTEARPFIQGGPREAGESRAQPSSTQRELEASVMRKSKLSEKERRFVDAYLGSAAGNATKAARLAGYAARSAHVAAARLLKKDKVKAAIAARQAKAAASADVTAERVVQELARIGFADIRQLFGADGNLKPVTELPDDAAATIIGIDVARGKTTTTVGDKQTVMVEDAVVKIRAADKIGALSLLCRKLGLLRDKVDVSGKVTLADVLDRSWGPKSDA